MLPAALTLHATAPGSDTAPRDLRLPFASALTMVACDEMASRTKGYADLAAAISQQAHPFGDQGRTTRELFARMVFNILVSNDDDHLRNHGFVRDPRLAGWRLSPLYDVVPRPGVAYERFLHLEVGLQGKAGHAGQRAFGMRAVRFDAARGGAHRGSHPVSDCALEGVLRGARRARKTHRHGAVGIPRSRRSCKRTAAC
jgi:hypothetical protein